MTLSDLLCPERVLLELEGRRKNDVLQALVTHLEKAGVVKDSPRLLTHLKAREAIHSTGIGSGLAIPHIAHPSLESVVLVLGRSRTGIDFESVDGKPVHLVFLLVTRDPGAPEYLDTLAQIARVFRKPENVKQVLGARSVDAVLKAIKQAEVGGKKA